VFVNMKYYTAFITHKQSAMTVKNCKCIASRVCWENGKLYALVVLWVITAAVLHDTIGW